MGTSIHTIDLGITHCYLIAGDGFVLVDTGTPGKANRFMKSLEKLGIDPGDIRLIVITHGHWDHTGSAAEIKELTGAKIAMHEREKPVLEGGLKPLPPGRTLWGKTLVTVMRLLMFFVTIRRAGVDISVTDAGLDLTPFGIEGRIVHTPGHTLGSISVLLDSGEVIAGDQSISALPMQRKPGVPIFAQDTEAVRASWRKMFEEGAKTAFPAHGKPFDLERIRKEMYS
ncbi:MAG: MBL fold metallo-hydrolase [Planctomycetota bacterium]|jgi:glyoxylase-like metal-dependent hydrolase (beta-lactamase superfamily II)